MARIIRDFNASVRNANSDAAKLTHPDHPVAEYRHTGKPRASQPDRSYRSLNETIEKGTAAKSKHWILWLLVTIALVALVLFIRSAGAVQLDGLCGSS